MKRYIFYLALTVFIFMNCSSSRKVTLLSEKEIADLSNNWNDSDSKLTAAAMVYDLTEKKWIDNYIKKTGNNPVIFVENIRNQSDEQFETTRFIKDIEREFLRSGKVTLAATANKRDQWRLDKIVQQTFTSDKTMKQVANETGADFVLIGTINSLIDNFEGKHTKFYKVNLELIELESNSKVWAKENLIKKLVEQDLYK